MKVSSVLAVITWVFSITSSNAVEVPKLHDDAFGIDVLGQFQGPLPNLCFGLAISSGTGELPRGLFITPGPLADRTKLFFMDERGEFSVLTEGLISGEGVLVARGQYGEGLLVSEIKNGRIVRIDANGTISEFAKEGFSAATPDNDLFGPAQMVFAPDVTGELSEVLYAADFSSGRVFRVAPDGSATPITDPLSSNSPTALGPAVVKGIAPFPALNKGPFGNGVSFVATSWNSIRSPNTGLMHYINFRADKEFKIDVEHVWYDTRADNINNVQLLSIAPALDGGSYIYIPSDEGSGSISRLDANGDITPFITGIYAAQIIEDSEDVFGGGLITCARSEDDSSNLVIRIHR